MNIIEIKNVNLAYGKKKLLNKISFDIKKGEIVAIVGPSGCGKTSLLKIINRLISTNTGDIYYNGINTKEIDLIELRKNIGLVFQDYNLFDNMTIMENLTCGLKHIKKMNEEKAIKKARIMLKKFDLQEKENNYPDQLSGGEKQRVALIRSLLMEPSILMLDEPTSALDKKNKQEIVNIIKDLSKEGITLIVVSHEEDFIKKITKRIIKINELN